MPRAMFHGPAPLRVGWRLGMALACAALFLSFLPTAFGQPSSLPRKDFWVPDGPVNAIIETNGIVYVGGVFDYVGRVSETGTALDLVAGTTDLDFPKFKGAIKTTITDGAGGWIVGGLFSSVGGLPVTNLARIRANRTLDTNWTPNPNGPVLALVANSTVLY